MRRYLTILLFAFTLHAQNTFCPTNLACQYANLNGVLNATQFTGADIFAKANAAWASCSNACAVFIPAGVYSSVTTTLLYPMVANGTAALLMDQGAIVNYTGSGDAIALLGSNTGNVNAYISGGTIVGTSAGISGIHFKAFSSAKVIATQVRGFSTGDGFFNQGGNTIDCFSCVTYQNKNGVHNVGVVVATVPFAANAFHWHGGQIGFNSNLGWFDDGSLFASVGANQNNTADAVIFEPNGVNGSSSTGHIFVQLCQGCSFTKNYFEYGAGQVPVNDIILGDGSNQPNSTTIKDNFFSASGATTINDFNSSHSVIEGNIEISANTNFENHGTLSSGTFVGCNAVASTNYLAGVDTGNDTLSTCNPSSVTWKNVSYPTVKGQQFNQLVPGPGIAVGALPAVASSPGVMIKVTDSTAIGAEGQTCTGGSSHVALAFSDGVTWKCF